MMSCIYRTYIYLDEDQARALDDAARAQGVSRAALVRRLIDGGLGQADGSLEADLAAIEATFDVASGDDLPERGIDARARHLDRIRTGR